MLMAFASNTGFHVVPSSFDTHTPPPAVPTQTVLRSPGTPPIQLIRPLMMPGPKWRARRPSNVSVSSFQASAAGAAGAGGDAGGAGAGGAARTRGANANAIAAITTRERTTRYARRP